MRLHLGLGVEEAEHKIPAWEHQMLLEQLEQERPWVTRAYTVAVEQIEGEPGEQERSGTTISPDPGSMAAAGFNVGGVG
jgi:hypothetical protein